MHPRRVYLAAAKDLWKNFVAPTLFMFGEVKSLEKKDTTFDGKTCLRWDSLNVKVFYSQRSTSYSNFFDMFTNRVAV